MLVCGRRPQERRPIGAAAIATVTAVVPTFRDLRLLERTVPALLASTDLAVEVVIVNDDPSQDVGAWLRERDLPCTRVVDMGRNTGFCVGVNRGYRESTSPYVFFCNADLYVTPGYLPALVAFLEDHLRAATAVGKLVRWDAAAAAPSPILDSTGIVVRRSRGSFDRGEGRPDGKHFDHTEEVFGGSGAALLARRAALEDVALAGGPFDQSFFGYKEDPDLAWRLRRRGWESWYVPAAVAYHERSSRGLNGDSVLRSPRRYLANQRAKPELSRRHSMKNEWLVLVANEGGSTFVRDLPFIVARQALALAANLVTSPRLTLSGLTAFGRALPAALRKRRTIQRSATVPASEVRSWFVRR